MNKLEKEYLRLAKAALDEAVYEALLQEKVTSDCAKKFGDWLFGEFRKKKEKDTDIENNYFEYLVSFIEGSFMKDGKTKLLTVLKDLKKCMESYPDILQPNTNNLWRGSSLDTKTINSLRNKYKKQPFSIINKMKFGISLFYLIDENWVYSPKSVVQSWSTKSESAVSFSLTNRWYHEAALYNTKFNKNELLFNSKFLNLMAKASLGNEENEIIRIGKKVNGCKLWVHELLWYEIIGEVDKK